jgi:tetratricopeptide (TPR) repeat protein
MKIRPLATTVALVLFLGCTSPPPSRLAATTQDVEADAMAAVSRGDWTSAADLLRRALRQNPTSAKLHYNLGVAASHVGPRDEAIREFQWIIANLAPELSEAQEARRWLIEAGVLARPTETTAAVPEQSTETAPRDSGIRGQVLWADGRPTARVQLFLTGVPNSPNSNEQFVMRTDDSGRFEFKRIPPGTYMLTNKVAGSPTWRLRVKLAPGEITSLDLGEDNSAKVRDDFPGA